MERPNFYDGTLSTEAWVGWLLARHASGQLSLHDVVPAVYVGVLEGLLPLDHLHLLDGSSVDWSGRVDGATGRGDSLLSCPPLARSLIQAHMQARVLVAYLN